MSEPRPTQKIVAYATLAGIGLLAAVVLGEVAVVGLAAPFVFALVVGLLSPVAQLPEVRLEIDACQLVEGDTATIVLELVTRGRVGLCEVAMDLPVGLRAEVPTAWSLGLDPGVPTLIEVPVAAQRYGRFTVGPVALSVPGLFGLLARFGVAGGTLELEVRPRSETLRTLVRALEVRAMAGDRLGHQPGDGIEFAEIRQYSPGSPGRINWRATARRGEPYVNLRHPERSTDVILLVDSFSAACLPRQVRAAAGLAGAYLGRHDRVGLVAFGGVLNWVEPAMGQAQLERLVAALTATQWHHSYAWKSAEVIPSRVLPANGLVLAISPLDDRRMLNALAAIRARGVDLSVIETVAPRTSSLSEAGEIAARLIELERAEVRANLTRRGVPVVAWHDGEPVEVALGALFTWRRRARRRPGR